MRRDARGRMNMKRFFLVTLFTGTLALTPFRALADNVVSIQPAASNASVGDSFTLDVDITGATDLYDFEFDIGFNPSVLSVTGVTEGSFLPDGNGGEPTFFLPGTIDNVGGSVSFNADTLLGPPPGVTGDGTLMVIDFTAIGAGTSAVTIENNADLFFQDSSGDILDPTLENGMVTVAGATAVPEPSALSLLAIGIVGLMGFAKRRGAVA
jgi:Cohesin domain/PEP-CTERM motif